MFSTFLENFFLFFFHPWTDIFGITSASFVWISIQIIDFQLKNSILKVMNLCLIKKKQLYHSDKCMNCLSSKSEIKILFIFLFFLFRFIPSNSIYWHFLPTYTYIKFKRKVARQNFHNFNINFSADKIYFHSLHRLWMLMFDGIKLYRCTLYITEAVLYERKP